MKPLVVDAWVRDEFSAEAYGILVAKATKAICNIPLVNHDRVLGILSISPTTETPFSPEDVEFLGRASGPIATAIENALAHREISELRDKLAREKILSGKRISQRDAWSNAADVLIGWLAMSHADSSLHSMLRLCRVNADAGVAVSSASGRTESQMGHIRPHS